MSSHWGPFSYPFAAKRDSQDDKRKYGLLVTRWKEFQNVQIVNIGVTRWYHGCSQRVDWGCERPPPFFSPKIKFQKTYLIVDFKLGPFTHIKWQKWFTNVNTRGVSAPLIVKFFLCVGNAFQHGPLIVRILIISFDPPFQIPGYSHGYQQLVIRAPGPQQCHHLTWRITSW